MKTLAIIGLGPRGLYALENLLINLCKKNKQVNILLFEYCEEPGAGQVWFTKQSNSNWTNITNRGLKGLKERPKLEFLEKKIKAFPSYHEWSNYSQEITDPDTFPARRIVGKYLNERFESLTKILENRNIQLIKSSVKSIDLDNDQVVLTTNNNVFLCDDVLLTIGHQPTKTSDQIKKWNTHAHNNNGVFVFENAYPLSQFNKIKDKKDLTIGIRGFGLAMIDVMRELVLNDYGKFVINNQSTFKSTYHQQKPHNLKLVPFSLDGLPLAPKPLNKLIDDWYKPTRDELSFFSSEIVTHAKTGKPVKSIEFLTNSISKITSRVYMELNSKALSNDLSLQELQNLVLKLLEKPDLEHKLIQDNSVSTYNLIKNYIDMALGQTQITLDYCLGQVWRHCQPTLYQSFSHAQLDDEIIKNVINLDEQSKRFSYGPPIESMQQVLALVDANVLNLEFVSNPDIKEISSGWQLINKKESKIKTNVMINCVLDAPKLIDVNSPIICSLLKSDLVEPIDTDLGINTTLDGYVKIDNEDIEFPVAVLGRLAKGSVIGVDAILECFGHRIKDWAKAYVNKL